MDNSSIISKGGVLIFSCDRYKDCWAPMLKSIDLYWPDCPFHRYVVSNHESIIWHDTTFIRVGDHQGFGNDMINALPQIPCEYVIYFQEDYFLGHVVNNDSIINHLKHCKEENLDLLKLSNDGSFRDDLRIGDSSYCANPIDKKYTINTVIGIWKKGSLLKTMIPGQNIWEWEKTVSENVKHSGVLFKSEMLHSTLYETEGIEYIPGGAIMRGKWTKSAIKFLGDYGFSDLINNRQHVSAFRQWLYVTKAKGPVLGFLKKCLLYAMNKL